MIVEAVDCPGDRIAGGPRILAACRNEGIGHAGHTRLGGTPKPGPACGLRRYRHRRRDFRLVYALPPARIGYDRTGVRNRYERRWHLVLESLSRRAFRFRKLDLWLFLFEGADVGMGLEGALFPPARHAEISELRRR